MSISNRRWIGAPCLALIAASAVASAFQPPGRLVAVNGHQMHLNCTGIGSPTVVLDSGLGGSFLDWSRVQPLVSDDVQVCSYDRSGYGYSQSGRRPRTSGVIAEELHALLHEAEVSGPYILVGHSFGGFNVRMFASRYPDEVAGLVLVDASQGEQVERLEANGGVPVAPRGRFMVFSPASLPPNLPERLKPVAEDRIYRALTNRTVYAELKWFRESAREVRQAAPLPDVPLVVISRGKREWSGSDEARRREAVWRDMQREFVARHPGAVHLIADYSGHYIPLEQPRIVSAGICMALQSARAGSGQKGGRLPVGWLKQRCLPSLQATWAE